MSNKPYPRTMYCPCGSNRKYKSCCAVKGVEFFIKPSGKIIRHEPMTDQERAVYEEQLRVFTTENGRQPSDQEDAILRAREFETVQSIVVQDMQRQGASPEIIYAYQKTGILVTRENQYQIPAEELKRWQAAIDEYRLQQNQ